MDCQNLSGCGQTPFQSFLIDCCRLYFFDTAAPDPTCPKLVFDLSSTIAVKTAVGKFFIKDANGTNTTLTQADLDALGITVDQVNSAANDCRCGVAVTPDPSAIDTEIICVEENDGLYLMTIDSTDPLAPIITISDVGGADATGTVTPTVCPDKEFKSIDTCFESEAGDKYTRCEVIEIGSNPIASVTYWKYPDGSVNQITPPVAVSICVDPTIEECIVTGGVTYEVNIPTLTSVGSEVEILDSAGNLIASNTIGSGDTTSVVFLGLLTQSGCYASGTVFPIIDQNRTSQTYSLPETDCDIGSILIGGVARPLSVVPGQDIIKESVRVHLDECTIEDLKLPIAECKTVLPVVSYEVELPSDFVVVTGDVVEVIDAAGNIIGSQSVQIGENARTTLQDILIPLCYPKGTVFTEVVLGRAETTFAMPSTDCDIASITISGAERTLTRIEGEEVVENSLLTQLDQCTIEALKVDLPIVECAGESVEICDYTISILFNTPPTLITGVLYAGQDISSELNVNFPVDTLVASNPDAINDTLSLSDEVEAYLSTVVSNLVVTNNRSGRDLSWTGEQLILDADTQSLANASNCQLIEETAEAINVRVCNTTPPVVIESREICLDVGGVKLNAYAIIQMDEGVSTLLRYENAIGEVLSGTWINCDCESVDIDEPDFIPLDSVICAGDRIGSSLIIDPIDLSPANLLAGITLVYDTGGEVFIPNTSLNNYTNQRLQILAAGGTNCNMSNLTFIITGDISGNIIGWKE